MKDKIFSYTKDRSFWTNLIIAVICFILMFIFPQALALLLNKVISNTRLCVIIGDVIFIVLLYLLYFKDLNHEAAVYFKDFKNKFKHSIKIYFLGFGLMVFFNLFIVMFLKEISSNESQVREMLYNSVLPTMISISIIAPITEELIFRKSIAPLIHNKWIYSLVCGLLFGLAHITTNFMQGIFVITDLLYILPYGALGASFALMDYENKTVFSSIIIHALHNTITAVLLLVTFFGGK